MSKTIKGDKYNKYKGFNYTERGHTLLSDEDGCTVMCAEIEEGCYQLIEYIPENYPAFSSKVLFYSEGEMAEHLMSSYPYWKAIKANVEGLVLDGKGYILDKGDIESAV